MRKVFAFSILLTALSSTPLLAAVESTEPPLAAAQSSNTDAAAQAALVNINSADAATLDRELHGIGAVKAQAIVEYREANGPFASVDELLEVKGIGAATLEKNRPKLSIQ